MPADPPESVNDQLLALLDEVATKLEEIRRVIDKERDSD